MEKLASVHLISWCDGIEHHFLKLNPARSATPAAARHGLNRVRLSAGKCSLHAIGECAIGMISLPTAGTLKRDLLNRSKCVRHGASLETR
jgi:hypothetical protein